MRTKKFKDLFWFGPKSNIKAGDGLDKGRFPFYTSSPKLTKWIDREQHFDEALIFGTGGLASVHFEDQPFSTSTDCIVAITTNKEIKTKFVYYYLFGNIHLLERGFKGAGLKHISKKYIENLDIPVLPIETQNKIVAILDKASSLVTKREESISMLDELLRATFLDMFGDPVINQKAWDLFPVSKISESRLGKMLDGKTIIGHNLKKYLRNSNVQWFKINLDDLLEMDFDEKDKIEFALKKGDVLMCEGGEIGRCAIWKNEIEDCYFQKALHRIRLNTKLITPEYFVFMFWLYAKHGGLDRYMGAATISHLTGEKLKRMEIPVPTIESQMKFSSIYNVIEAKKSVLNSSLFSLNELIKSIIQKAFKDELELNYFLKILDKNADAVVFFDDNIDYGEVLKKLIDSQEIKKSANKKTLKTNYKNDTSKKALWAKKSILGKVSNIRFNDAEGNAVFKKEFSKKLKGFGFDEFEAFIKSEGFTYEYQQLKDFIFDKLENNELVQYYSDKEWRELNYKKESSPFQDDFAGDGNIFLVPNITHK